MLSDPKGHMSFHIYSHMIVNRDVQFPGGDIVDGSVVFYERSPLSACYYQMLFLL